jgi:Subtilase family
MDWLNHRWGLLAGVALVWSALGAVPAGAQIYPSFRTPSMPMISPIGPRDPAMHVAPGNISNIPMGGSAAATGTTSSQTGRRTKKKITTAVSRNSTTSATTARKVTSTGGGGRASAGGGAGAGGTGALIPPPGETRFAQDEVLAFLAGNASAQAVDALVRRNRVTLLERLDFRLTNSTVLRLRVPNGRSTVATVRALGNYRGVTTQPNYRFVLADDQPGGTAETAGVLPGGSDVKRAPGDPAQYALAKLHLREAQGLAKGEKVSVAIVDSGIDAKHPDLNGAVTAQFDALGSNDPPHAHGTAIAGIVAAHGRLLGAAPSVNILAVRAFGAAAVGADGTTFNILKGLDWAAGQGARIINLSFTGPSDPMLGRALAALHQRGAILIAAVGNAGPKSPPLYPAADPNVIAVTATDANDGLFEQANRGSYIAVAAPGADVLVLAPDAAYQLSSGTSFAAAYVTGIAALMLERKPGLDPDALKKALQSSAKDLGPKGRDDQFGAGLADAYQAIIAVDPAAEASARSTH